MKNLLLLLIALFILNSCTSSAEHHSLYFEKPADLQEFFDYQQHSHKMVSAHRGGAYANYPENCLETFQYVLEHTPAILEIDVEMSHDSVLMLMHDATLDRTTTGLGSVRDKRWAELKKLRLLDPYGHTTNYQIPRFNKVLQWAKKNTLLTVDVKEGVPFQKVVETIEKNESEACAIVIVYSLEDALKVYELNPELMISLGLTSEQEIEAFLASGIPAENILAFTGLELQTPAFYERLNDLGIPTILGTFNTADLLTETPDQMQYYRQYWEGGVDIIATDLPIEVGEYLQKEMKDKSQEAVEY